MITAHGLASLSTASREFAALKGLPYYDSRLLADALAGRSAELPKINSDIVEQIQKDYQLNEPQARAILGALRARGFALIQGYARGSPAVTWVE